MPATATNTLQKTYIQTFKASFAPRTYVKQNYARLLMDCFIIFYKDIEEVI
jgi:hypothetical protein